MDMETDLGVVILSTGKSLLPADVVVPTRPTADATCSLPGARPPALLLAARRSNRGDISIGTRHASSHSCEPRLR